MSDVDAIWAEMRASAAPANANSASPAVAASKAAAPLSRSGASGKPVIRLRGEAAVASAAASAAQSAAAPRSAEELFPALQREINALSDERVESRRRALQNLYQSLVAAPAANTSANDDGLGDASAAATDAGVQHCTALRARIFVTNHFFDLYPRIVFCQV